MKLIFLSIITCTMLIVLGPWVDEPEALSRRKYLFSPIDSSKVADSGTVKLTETIDYTRDDFNLLLKEFCTDKPISPEELIENRSVFK